MGAGWIGLGISNFIFGNFYSQIYITIARGTFQEFINEKQILNVDELS